MAAQRLGLAGSQPDLGEVGEPEEGRRVEVSHEEIVGIAGLRDARPENSAAESDHGSASTAAEETVPDPHDPLQRVRLELFDSADGLEDCGLELLREELDLRGMKCGGTLTERAQRLWLARGVAFEARIHARTYATRTYMHACKHAYTSVPPHRI